MANIKPASLRTGKTGKEEKGKREIEEDKLKSTIPISILPPDELSDQGKKVYVDIIGLLPTGFLSGADTYIVCIVAESLNRMQTCQIKLNDEGLFTEEGFESNAVKMYERYSKIFDKFSAKLGLSPKDRAALAVLNITADDKENDPVLGILVK